MENITLFLLISAIVLFIIVFYRWLLRYLRKDEIPLTFSYLFPFENKDFSGVENIKIEMKESYPVRVELLNAVGGDLVLLAFDERIGIGEHELELDFSQVKDGLYHLRIVLPDQAITRYVSVKNTGRIDQAV